MLILIRPPGIDLAKVHGLRNRNTLMAARGHFCSKENALFHFKFLGPTYVSFLLNFELMFNCNALDF